MPPRMALLPSVLASRETKMVSFWEEVLKEVTVAPKGWIVAVAPEEWVIVMGVREDMTA